MQVKTVSNYISRYLLSKDIRKKKESIKEPLNNDLTIEKKKKQSQIGSKLCYDTQIVD